MIYLHEPHTANEEIKNVLECFKKNELTFGHYIKLFEKKIKNLIKVKYAVACVNGTSALQIAIKLLNLNNNEEIIVPSLTFISPVNAIKYNNLNPIFMDSDDSLNIDEKKTIEFLKINTYQKYDKKNKTIITINKKTKKRIGAVLIVHTFGNPCKINNLINKFKKKNIKIIEDNAESLGAFYKTGKLKNKYTGSISDISCVSFNGNKIITTAGGGMILTNNKKYEKKARYLINQAKNNSLKFIHKDIGYNFRISNIQAAIGCAQIKKLKGYIKKKKTIYQTYKKEFSQSTKIKLFSLSNFASSNYWLNLLYINPKNKINKNLLIKKLYKKGIQVRPIWQLNHLQKPYKINETYNIKNAQKLIKNYICLPSSPNLTKKQIKFISSEIQTIINDS